MENFDTTRAACRGADPEIFFPESPVAGDLPTAQALALCRGCPVRAECLDHALAVPERFGIWGGTLPADRALLTGVRRAS